MTAWMIILSIVNLLVALVVAMAVGSIAEQKSRDGIYAALTTSILAAANAVTLAWAAIGMIYG